MEEECGKIPITKTRFKYSLREKWETFGRNLFDVVSSEMVSKSNCFVGSFYDDQKTSRSLMMFLIKVTKEFAEEELNRKKKEAAKQRRIELSYFHFDEADHDKDVTSRSEVWKNQK